VLAVRNRTLKKWSAMNAGLTLFCDARMKFESCGFYLVSILFIIFDWKLLSSFLAVAFQDVSMAGFWSTMVFLAC